MDLLVAGIPGLKEGGAVEEEGQGGWGGEVGEGVGEEEGDVAGAKDVNSREGGWFLSSGHLRGDSRFS